MAGRGVLLAVAAATSFGTTPAPTHPLHTTLTELMYVRGTGSVEVSIRVFADDFGAAAARRGGVAPGYDHSVPDSVAMAYVAATFTLADRAGRPLALSWCGYDRSGDLLWLCLRASAPGGLAGARVHARMLFEVFDDQVNIVQVADGGRRNTLLFTKGDGAKRL